MPQDTGPNQGDHWTNPRPHRDMSMRQMQYGKIQPMETPGFFARLLKRK